MKTINLPTYDFYKRLKTPLNIEYSRLEKAYNTYDATHAHRHDYYELLIFNGSGGTHEIDFVKYPVKKFSIHFLSPGQVHLLKRNKSVMGHVIAFKDEALITTPHFESNFLLLSHAAKPALEINKKEFMRINAALNNLIGEYQDQHSHSKLSLSAYLMLLLIEIIRLQENEHSAPGNNYNNLYYKFRQLVEKNYAHIHSVSKYSDMLNVTSGHLNDTIKKACGKSASEFVHERLVLEAKRLLYHSPLSIKEISSQLNYEDPAYFIRFFRKQTGHTPRSFREAIRTRE